MLTTRLLREGAAISQVLYNTITMGVVEGCHTLAAGAYGSLAVIYSTRTARNQRR